MGSFPFFSNKRRHFSLVTGGDETFLLEVIRHPDQSRPGVEVLAASQGSPDNEITLHRLLTSVSGTKRTVSVALPLTMFEMLTVTIPNMPEEAVGRALPYHLAKTIQKPLQDFIYDWQVTGSHKDSMEITAYLYSRAAFTTLHDELAKKNIEIISLEPDIYSAVAFLDVIGRLQTDKTCLCSLIWPNSCSHAIYEKGRLKLVRNVLLRQPDTPFSDQIETDENETATPETNTTFQVAEPPIDQNVSHPPSLNNLAPDPGHSILDDFALSISESPAEPVLEAESPKIEPGESHPQKKAGSGHTGWQDYITGLGLEIIRTRDYYASIMKGSSIGNLYVGGCSPLLPELTTVTASAMSLSPEDLLAEPSSGCPAILEAIAIGTGIR
ncbi:MAG: hypothetical protein KJ950_12130 [Proteobacteria bacterium]|nr:hypothetical protein [Pseudomonadota bacterium]MBU1688080.1 hypothetical protein [Pseudomonadota bacterium]